MPQVLVFGGTTEGREITEWLSARGDCEVLVSSLTEYGGSLVKGLAHVTSLTGQMLPHDIQQLLHNQQFSCVIDATHPYAAGVSVSIAEAADRCQVPLYRVLRESEPEGAWTGVDSAQQAAEYLAGLTGNVLLTTGSKDLPVYAAAIPRFEDRVFARILPVASSLQAASELGLSPRQIIAMKGPFSKQLNCALIREFDIAIMVTKASGVAGGFWEKVEAAQECGIELVVIHRPLEEEGLTMQQLKDELEKALGL